MEAKSLWICENNVDLSTVVRVLDNFPLSNILELLNEDACVSLKRPEGQSESECSICVIINNEDRHEINSEPFLSKLSLINQSNIGCEDLTQLNKNLPECKPPLGPENAGNPNVNEYIKHNPTILEKFGFPKGTSLNFMSNSDSNFSSPITNNPDIFILELIVLSEAKYIEIYTGPHEEYFKTFHSELVLELEDSKIYQTVIVLPKPEKNVMMKMKGLFSQDSLWLYGIFIKVKKVISNYNKLLSPGSMMNCNGSNNLTSILKDRNINLSEKAEKFKKLMDMCSTFQGASDSTTMRALFSALPIINALDIDNNERGKEKSNPISRKQKTSDEKLSNISSNLFKSNFQNKTQYVGEDLIKMGFVDNNPPKHINPSTEIDLDKCFSVSNTVKSSILTEKSVTKEPVTYRQNYLTLELEDSINDKKLNIPPESTNNTDFTSFINFLVDQKFKELEEGLLVKILSVHEDTNKRLQNIENLLMKLTGPEKNLL